MEDTVLSRTVHAEKSANKPNIPAMSLLDLIENTLTSEKAEDIITIDLRGKSSVADHMIVASGRSSRQVAALADKVQVRIKEATGETIKTEGKSVGDWVLLDAGNVIVHIFRPEVREFYQLEKMWDGSAAEPANA